MCPVRRDILKSWPDLISLDFITISEEGDGVMLPTFDGDVLFRPCLWGSSSMADNRPPLIVIVGPTGVGKTASAVALAGAVGGEIVSADAMQVYREMDIGTAKPSREEQERVTHHLIDVVRPDEAFDAARFVAHAQVVIEGLHRKAIPAFLVGGTGLYVKALTRGLFGAEGVETNRVVRERLRAEEERLGRQGLHERLSRVDPVAAARIHPNDLLRIVRALEVYESTGVPISDHHDRHGFSDSPYRVLKLGLRRERRQLYDRINQRVEDMVRGGLVEEVEGLFQRGYDRELKSMSAIGYRHVAAYLAGELTWNETLETLKRDTRRYAKRQMTWFGADPQIEWFEPTQIQEMGERIGSFLTRSGRES